MINRIIICVLAAIEVLSLFPAIFFGVATTITDVKQVQDSTPMIVMAIGIVYMAAVLLGAYMAIQNLNKPAKAYVFLALPLLIATGFLIYKF